MIQLFWWLKAHAEEVLESQKYVRNLCDTTSTVISSISDPIEVYQTREC